MKKIFASVFSIFILCGFESLSDQVNNFEVTNLTPAAWEIEQTATTVKAYNKASDLELTFYVDNFMPSSPQCVSNKRIKDIKFDVDIYKKAQKGDMHWAKMVERMKIRFSGLGYDEEKKVYGSNLIKNNAPYAPGEIVHIGTLQFLAPYPCEKVDNMKMRVTDLRAKNQRLAPLEILFKLKN